MAQPTYDDHGMEFNGHSKIFEKVPNEFVALIIATSTCALTYSSNELVTLRVLKSSYDYNRACENLTLLSVLKQSNRSMTGNKKIINISCAWAINHITAYHIGPQTFPIRRWCFIISKILDFIDSCPLELNDKSIYNVVRDNAEIPEHYYFRAH